MRKLYSFKLDKETEIDEIKTSTIDGKEVKIVEKVKNKIPFNYFIAKPGRALTEESDIFYNSTFWKLVRSGILPQNQLRKRLSDDGGVLSEEQSKQYNDLYDKLFQKQAEHRSLNLKSDKTDEDAKQSEKVMDEIVDIMSTLQSFEVKTGAELYQNTAESLARNKLCLFWTLMLSYQDKDGKEIPVFGDGDYEKKLKRYDEIELKEDPFEYELIRKCLLICSLWVFQKAETQEDFDLLLRVSENSELIEATKTLGIKEESQEKGAEITPKLEETKV